jgi:DNA-binding TFAR19-related protein (PDSD5 family)
MSQNPKPVRQIQRRMMRALQRQGPTSFVLPPEPQNVTERERREMEDEMLMRIVPPKAKRR